MLSVIVPCWNAEESIERALASVLSERDHDLEVVVVDDASTDRTAEVVASIAANDPRVILLRTPTNEGASAARNRALAVIRGDWVTFLDADDRLYPGGLAALARAGTGGDVLAVVGQRVWTDGDRTWRSPYYDIPDVRTPGRASLVARPGLLSYASATGKLIHRSCIEGLRFHGRVLGDQPWTIRALLRAGDRIEVIADDVYEWWRPAKDDTRRTITSLTRSSARFGVEVAEMAEQALAEVAAEARDRLDGASATMLTARYLDRLLRSDLGIHLSRALARRDPTTDELLVAIARFLTSAPRGLVRRSAVLPEDILEPPLRSWRTLDSRARRAYAGLVRAATAADPGVWCRMSTRTDRLVVRAVGRAPAGPGARAIGFGLAASRLTGRARRRFGRLARFGRRSTSDPVD